MKAENRATILEENGSYKYFDKNGVELQEGDMIKYDSGKVRKLYRTENECLGIDATNPLWISSGRACECEYGIYPLEYEEMKEIEKV